MRPKEGRLLVLSPAPAPQSSPGPEHPLSLQVLDAKGNLTALKTYWVTLPGSLCSKKVVASSAADDKCWNGMTKGRYGGGQGARMAPFWGDGGEFDKRLLHIIPASPGCLDPAHFRPLKCL